MVRRTKATITLINWQKTLPLDLPQIKKIILKVLKHEGVSEAVLSFVFVDDNEIKSFNKRFLGRTYATDVLAFDLRVGIETKKKKFLRGDIIISADTVKRNAKEFQNFPKQELILCTIHGILHLLGYDDHAPGDIKRMRAREAKILTYLNRKGSRA